MNFSCKLHCHKCCKVCVVLLIQASPKVKKNKTDKEVVEQPIDADPEYLLSSSFENRMAFVLNDIVLQPRKNI